MPEIDVLPHQVGPIGACNEDLFLDGVDPRGTDHAAKGSG